MSGKFHRVMTSELPRPYPLVEHVGDQVRMVFEEILFALDVTIFDEHVDEIIKRREAARRAVR